MHILYKCGFCDRTGSEDAILEHERECVSDPKNRACSSCKFHSLEFSGLSYWFNDMCSNPPNIVDEVKLKCTVINCERWEYED